MTKKPKRGGKRPGSGRKSKYGTTTVLRFPLMFLEDVKKFIEQLKAKV